MPQIAQQDYKVIAPKEGRSFNRDAAALAELKKAILAGIGFDCLIKDTIADDGDINRVLGFYPNGSVVDYYSIAETEVKTLSLQHTVTQYQGLAAVQQAEDEYMERVAEELPHLYLERLGFLSESIEGVDICVNGFKLSVTSSGGRITALEISDTKPSEGAHFINIAWEDALKLIGLPIA